MARAWSCIGVAPRTPAGATGGEGAHRGYVTTVYWERMRLVHLSVAELGREAGVRIAAVAES
jgi:hypothetical protein